MKFKKIVKPIIAIFALAVFVLGCKQEEEDFSLPSHSVLEVSHQYQNFTISVNQEVSFADLSTGIVDRTWSLDDGVVADVFKLDKDVPDILEIRDVLRNRQNLTEEEYQLVRAKLLIGDQTILPTYEDNILKLSFPTAGVYNIYVNQVFENNAFVEQETTARDTNIIDRVLTVTVTDRLGFSNFTVSELDNSGTPGVAMPIVIANNVIEQGVMVTAGKTARIGFNYTGAPDSVTIESGTGKVVDNSLVLNTDGTGSIDIKYSRVGQYDLVFTAVRSTPAGTLTTTLENPVEVIPSTEPVTLDKAIVTEDGNVKLTFSREMESSTLVPSDFSIDIKDKNGASIAVTVDNAELDTQDASLLTLTLAGDRAYDDDTVTVTYTKNAFATTDGVLLETQTDYAVLTGQNPDLLEGAGMFENDLGVDWNWVGNKVIPEVEITDPPTPANVTNVSPSGRVVRLTHNKNGGTNLNAANCESARIVPGMEVGKSYRFTFKRYVRDNPSAASRSVNLIFRFVPTTGGNGDQFFSLGVGNANNLDRWIEGEYIFTADKASYVDAKLRLVTNWSAYADVHLDDVVLQVYNLRP